MASAADESNDTAGARAPSPTFWPLLKAKPVFLSAAAPKTSSDQRGGGGESSRNFQQVLGSWVSTGVLATLFVVALMLLVAAVLYFTRKKKAEDRKFLLDSGCT